MLFPLTTRLCSVCTDMLGSMQKDKKIEIGDMCGVIEDFVIPLRNAHCNDN